MRHPGSCPTWIRRRRSGTPDREQSSGYRVAAVVSSDRVQGGAMSRVPDIDDRRGRGPGRAHRGGHRIHGSGRRPHQPADRRRHVLDQRERAVGVGAKPVERRLLHVVDLLCRGRQQDIGAGGGTLVEQWNGSSWAVVASVNPPSTSGDELDSVSCVGPAFCMAVGTSGQGAVAETWNGTTWTLANPVIPSSVTGGAVLSSVSCVSTTVCETLGTGYNATPTPMVFGNQWNGSAWSLVSAATPSVSGSFPTPVIEATGMDCVTTTWCVAVGTTNANVTATTPFAEQWNGSSWSLVSVAVPSGAGVIGSYLASVSCVAPLSARPWARPLVPPART